MLHEHDERERERERSEQPDPQETMLRDSVALANLKEYFVSEQFYLAEDDEDGETAAQIADSSYKLADAFLAARRRNT